jgi:hypothetical protein
MRTFYLTLTYLVLFTALMFGKVKITVNAGDYARENCVVSADVSSLSPDADATITLTETTGKKRSVPCQLIFEQGQPARLYWLLDGTTPRGAVRTFVAQKAKKKSPSQAPMTVEDNSKALILKQNGKSILQYNYTTVEPPEGVDKVFRRSGFIHPAWSPAGNVLTNISPADHRHHFGIWNPWTKLQYDGAVYDLWNIGDKKGTVRARGIENTYSGNICAGYNASLVHYIFKADDEKAIMNELWKVKAYDTDEGFLWDFVSVLLPSTSLPVLLKEYRYAGFGYRATPEWTKENCIMLTSEGKTRQQIDGSTARWIFITGDTKTGRSGLLFLGHPDNYNSPEPLRIWDENANGGRGDAFINFAPTKNKDWELRAGENYTLRYRVLAYEGEMTPERANRLWNDFAHPPAITVK